MASIQSDKSQQSKQANNNEIQIQTGSSLFDPTDVI